MRIRRIAADFDAPTPPSRLCSAADRVNLLLDTHVFLWWDRADKALNADARA